jgi:hypothetical protein
MKTTEKEQSWPEICHVTPIAENEPLRGGSLVLALLSAFTPATSELASAQ